MNTQNTSPIRFCADFRFNGEHRQSPAFEHESQAEAYARQQVREGAKYAAILRDSGGTDHPDNAGKFFLHRYVKA